MWHARDGEGAHVFHAAVWLPAAQIERRKRMSATSAGPDGQSRCRWCGGAPEHLDYHDSEWGSPVGDDRRLFEKLSLEGFQSGLSWRTILAKCENLRAARD